jgi:hypothetical protein
VLSYDTVTLPEGIFVYIARRIRVVLYLGTGQLFEIGDREAIWFSWQSGHVGGIDRGELSTSTIRRKSI